MLRTPIIDLIRVVFLAFLSCDKLVKDFHCMLFPFIKNENTQGLYKFLDTRL